jgi:hypothetical protein
LVFVSLLVWDRVVAFEFAPQLLFPFLELSRPGCTAFSFDVSPLAAGGFPALELLCHVGLNRHICGLI